MTQQAGTPASAPDELALAAEFDRPERAEWERLVAGVLEKSGGEFDHLTSTTYDGITIQPLYTADDAVRARGFPGLAPFVRGTRADGHVTTGWDVRVRHEHADPAAASEAVLADLEGGATSVWLRVGGRALPVGALGDALAGVELDMVSLALDPGADYVAAADALLELAAERGIPDGEVRGTLGADPIGLTARTGVEHALEPAAALAVRVASGYPALRTISVDGLPFHEAGASDAQELGAAIASGVAYLRALTEAGLATADAVTQLEFRLSATADQFLTIAKFRAARRLWARVLEVSGVDRTPATAMTQHAVTSFAMRTQRDPWVNMLRDTVACFAAGVGGADAVTVLPFDAAIGASDPFSRRIARNTQAILLEESKLAGVIDPAGGSWYVEHLTDALAHAAWDEFTAIESAGGIVAELASGALAGRIGATWQARSARIATRTDPITGVSEFPDLHEKAVERAPAPTDDTDDSDDTDGTAGLPRVRYAQYYEALRDRSDAWLAEHGERPSVYLATLGPLAAHTARLTFASNLFQAGGVEPVSGAVDEYSGQPPVVCLCGGDKSYSEEAVDAVARLRSAGARTVLLAGKPDDGLDVDGSVHIGCDALGVLRRTLDELGVSR